MNKKQNELKVKEAQPTILQEKKFLIQDSLLIQQFDTNQNIRTMYHLFVVSLLLLLTQSLTRDYLTFGRIISGFRLIYVGFGKLHIVVAYYAIFLFLTCVNYYFFNLWALVRHKVSAKPTTCKIWDFFWISVTLIYYMYSFYLASSCRAIFQLPVASAAIVHIETVRFLMKTHAFVWTTAVSVLRQDDGELRLPTFSSFFYFLFAPTLIYRDHYPRVKTIRWSFVIARIVEILAGILYVSLLLETPYSAFEDYGRRKYTWTEIILALINQTIPGICLYVTLFFIILHSTQNAFAEILRFGDKRFYEDWWNSTNYQEFFRKWNLLVNDWLFHYVYKNIYTITSKNKFLAKITVFILSLLVHEWIASSSMGYFFPIMTISFSVAVCMTFVSTPKMDFMNICILFLLGLGNGLLIGLFFLEYSARANAPLETPEFKDYIIPRWLNCNCTM